MIKAKDVDHIRLILDVEKPKYWALPLHQDDYKTISAKTAMRLLREGVPCICAIADPNDQHSHYESNIMKMRRI